MPKLKRDSERGNEWQLKATRFDKNFKFEQDQFEMRKKRTFVAKKEQEKNYAEETKISHFENLFLQAIF